MIGRFNEAFEVVELTKMHCGFQVMAFCSEARGNLSQGPAPLACALRRD